jgi:hypothetical protein
MLHKSIFECFEVLVYYGRTWIKYWNRSRASVVDTVHSFSPEREDTNHSIYLTKELQIGIYPFKIRRCNFPSTQSVSRLQEFIFVCLLAFLNYCPINIGGGSVHMLLSTLQALIMSVKMIDPPLVCISLPKQQLQCHSLHS